MGIGYQKVDRRAYDYDLWFPENQLSLGLRGPRTDLDAENKISFIGAAQTFGRFVKNPFPTQVASFLEKPVLNLGFSGAGPEFYISNDYLMKLLKDSETVVVQSMSARSVSAGLFEAQRNNGVLKFTEGPRQDETMLALEAYRILRKEYGEDAFQKQVRLVQEQWIKLHRELFEQLQARKIFLWLSETKPGENVQLETSPLGIFPHLVTKKMVSEIKDMGYEFVECVLPGMPPQIIVNDTTGIIEPVFNEEDFPKRPSHLRYMNSYYATPELHNKAANHIIRHLIATQEAEKYSWRARMRRLLKRRQ